MHVDQVIKALVLGVATLDALHSRQGVDLAWGGVSKNVACALGRLGHRAVFVSPGHGPEWDAALSRHLHLHQVSWQQLPVLARLPFYEAFLQANGDVRREHFHDNAAFAPLTPALLKAHLSLCLSGQDVVIVSSDLPVASLRAVQRLCRQQAVPLYVISSSVKKAGRLKAVKPDLLALNRAELNRLLPEAPLAADDLGALAQAAAGLIDPQGACLLTLGAEGALLVLPAAGQALYQAVPRLTPDSTVGAGDTFFAALICFYHQYADWSGALEFASRQTLVFLCPEAPAVHLPAQQMWTLG